MTNNDEHTPELAPAVRDAVRDYNTPPEMKPADLDAMWTAIEARSFRSDIGGRVTDRDSAVRDLTRRWFAPRTMLQIAATLVIGVAIGRYAIPAPNALPATSVSRRMMLDTLALPEPYYSTTTRYFGQAAALLVALPAEARAGRADSRLTGRAHDLLLTTRLLLDSPAADDARIRGLLEDLELVFAQVARLQSGAPQGNSELELIRQAMDQRDVLPRLRSAVVDISAGDE
ncbi:MAG: hypothetical protein AABZ80_07390 [Gemmatimonadota bacterium]